MALFGHSARHNLPDREQTLPGRDLPLPGIPDINLALGTSMHGPWPDGTQVLYLAMGCFWGSERIYWRLPGVVTTAAGYQGGYTPNPTYDEVCSGRTGHAEAVLVAYDPAVTSIDLLLKAFWENHDPTQGFRQGNDHGTQYRSALWWTTPEQEQAVLATRDSFQDVLRANRFGDITTELRPAEEAGEFYYAEAVHQQYLHKNPGGYCNHGPNGMTCPVGIVRQDQLPSQESVLGRTD